MRCRAAHPISKYFSSIDKYIKVKICAEVKIENLNFSQKFPENFSKLFV
tara:strand:- start:699 stop:845 length:147 start_codon:yes stop_codon:yes gene_type:complete